MLKVEQAAELLKNHQKWPKRCWQNLNLLGLHSKHIYGIDFFVCNNIPQDLISYQVFVLQSHLKNYPSWAVLNPMTFFVLKKKDKQKMQVARWLRVTLSRYIYYITYKYVIAFVCDIPNLPYFALGCIKNAKILCAWLIACYIILSHLISSRFIKCWHGIANAGSS